ncbi:MAG TPA: family 78 glycoside hydrolase catalytic domain [Conexibacter sp.]|jgi:alpha-L-rhamnosidase
MNWSSGRRHAAAGFGVAAFAALAIAPAASAGGSDHGDRGGAPDRHHAHGAPHRRQPHPQPGHDDRQHHPASSLAATRLTVGAMPDPLGVQQAQPRLGWQLTGGGTDQAQSAYEVRVASSAARLARGDRGADLWDTGRVRSTSTSGIAYAGHALQSRERVYWQVRVWDANGRAGAWSDIATWENGLLDQSDWHASWIGNPSWDAYESPPQPITIDLPPQQSRYVRIDVTKLGLPLQEGWPDPVSRLQLAEAVVSDSSDPTGADLARGAKATASDPYLAPGAWSPSYLTDGKTSGDTAPYGYTSLEHHGQDVSADPVWVQLDLGAVKQFDRVTLYPRTDTLTADGSIANFPSDFAVETAPAADGPFTAAKAVTEQEPQAAQRPAALPLFAKQFSLRSAPIASARLYITGLGAYDASINGRTVGDGVLEPGNTDYGDHVVYADDDVARLLRHGSNAIGVRLGTGIYDTQTYNQRYVKFSGRVGPPKLLAQLEVTYADGSTQTIASDQSWRTTLGPTTFSNWYGGEDFDATREPASWDQPSADLSSWQAASRASPPADNGTPATLTTRSGPSVQPVDTLTPQRVTQPKPGVYVVDFGTNVAGWEQLHIAGPRGTHVTMRPAELLKDDGTIDQGATGSPIYDVYTLKGGGAEAWHPDFVYHGFRYVQLEGLPSAPTRATLSAIVLRAANRSVGSFDSSNDLLDGIHRIIDRAVQSNMYSVLTDCPTREKLGWMEQDHLAFDSVARNYDISAYGRDLVQAMADAQLPNGLEPDIAPEYTVFDGGFRDDPNWGDAIVLVPWDLYETYGDRDLLAAYYDNMKRYVDYLGTRATGSLLDYGLADWGTINAATPAGVTASYGYFQAAQALGQIAAVLGKQDDAAHYAQLAGSIGTAFNATYLDPVGHTYANGSQTSDALALDMGIVPDSQRQAVLDHLVANLKDNGYHLNLGEIGLPALFRVLSNAGRDDVVYEIATQTTQPSYGAMLARGATSLTEFWDGSGSQNHFMLGAIDSWFTSGLAGIRQAPGSAGYRELDIAPAVVGDLTHVEGSYDTANGDVRSAWQRSGQRVTLEVTVPDGSTATVHVPGGATHRVGSGTYRFSGRLAG